MNDCKTCKKWQPTEWARPSGTGRAGEIAHHTGKCPVLLHILLTDAIALTWIETPAAFGCKFWAAK